MIETVFQLHKKSVVVEVMTDLSGSKPTHRPRHMRAFHIHMIKEKCVFPLYRDTLRGSQAAGRYNDEQNQPQARCSPFAPFLSVIGFPSRIERQYLTDPSPRPLLSPRDFAFRPWRLL
jgi:hypothetical protein